MAGLDVKPNAHSLRTSVTTDLTELGFEPEFMRKLLRWSEKSIVYQGYDQTDQLNKMIDASKMPTTVKESKYFQRR